jgi:DNA-binding transcriptional ArsR family regulator
LSNSPASASATKVANTGEFDLPAPTGDELLRMCASLANPHRLQILAVPARGGRRFVSQLARELGMSRALLQVHLRRLGAAKLVSSTVELARDGKAMKYYDVMPFAFWLTPAAVARAEESLSPEAFTAERRGTTSSARTSRRKWRAMNDWANVVFVLGILTLSALVVTVVVSQVSSVLPARSSRARENEYRVLAQRAAETQEQTLAKLTALRSRVDAVDAILRQVD